MTDSKRFLVVGATGVAGTAAIQAIRHHFGPPAELTALWYGPTSDNEGIPGADHSLHVDISSPDAVETIRRASGDVFDFCFFAMARGEVGFPIEQSTPQQVAEACRFSVDPLEALEAGLSVGVLVAYSTFYNLVHQRINYGAMGYAKEKIELWAGDSGRSRHVCIRAGAFQSASSKAIKLMLRRRSREFGPNADPLLRSFFEGRKPSEAVDLLEQAVLEEERQRYGDTGTNLEGLREAHLALFENPEARFVNVCGRKIWISENPQRIGESAG